MGSPSRVTPSVGAGGGAGAAATGGGCGYVGRPEAGGKGSPGGQGVGVGGPALVRATGAAGPADQADMAGGAGCAAAVAEYSISEATAERLALHGIQRWGVVRVIGCGPSSGLLARECVYPREGAFTKATVFRGRSLNLMGRLVDRRSPHSQEF